MRLPSILPHTSMKMTLLLLVVVLLLAIPGSRLAAANGDGGDPGLETVRFATYNASMNRFSQGQLGAELAVPGSPQPDAVAEIIQRIRPDVLLINEFDYDPAALASFQANYLAVPHGDAEPIDYPYSFIAPSNTGVFSGFDLDNSGAAGDFLPGDSFGFGFFPGQFGMAVLSKYPIDTANVRTFQRFLWKDMPGALLPDDPRTPAPADWYSEEELEVFRLSSKSHWDVPLLIDGKTVHFLVSHPTPPVFDDPPFYPAGVDFNGRRNFDEIRFWADYITPGERSAYIYDDAGNNGGLKPGELFVIAGDQNSDPFDGDSIPGSAQLLLDHPLVNTKVTPSSAGGVEQAILQNDVNDDHSGDPAYDTADFGEPPGNLRADYVLPRKTLQITEAAVFWPLTSDPLYPLIGASDHRPVYIDVRVPGT